MQVYADHFDPANVTMPAGDSISWSNRDTAAHTVCFGDPNKNDPDFCDDLAPGATSPAHTLNAPGSYIAIVCPDSDCSRKFTSGVTVQGDASSPTTVGASPSTTPSTKVAAAPAKSSSSRTTEATVALATSTAESLTTTTTTTESPTTTTIGFAVPPTFPIRQAGHHHQTSAPIVFAVTLGVIGILASVVHTVERNQNPMR